MKHVFKPIICSCLALASYATTIHAQDLVYASNSTSEADKFRTITSEPNTAVEMPAVNVASKAMRAFTKSYQDAANVKWYAQNKHYVAMFDWGGLQAHALLGKNGAIIYDVRYGYEKDLSAATRKLVKSQYVDFTIGRVTEVNVDGKNAWVINLEDANNIIIARVMDGALDELARYDTRPQAKLHKKARIVIPRD